MNVEVLGKGHLKADFCSGNEWLDHFLRELARRHDERGFGRTYVAVEAGDPTVRGYATLSVGSVQFEHIPDEIRKKLPRYPMPVVHLGRLAVDQRFAGKGVGKLLLRHAITETLRTADSVGTHALEVVAIDEAAHQYYLERGFIPLDQVKSRLYLPVKTLRQAVGELSKSGDSP